MSDKKVAFWLSIVTLVLIGWLSQGLIFNESRSKSNNMALCLKYKKEVFFGKIIKTEISENRGTFIMTILVNQEEKQHFTYCLEHPETRIEVGDSIYKPSNKFIYYIFKKSNFNNVDTFYCDTKYCDKWE